MIPVAVEQIVEDLEPGVPARHRRAIQNLRDRVDRTYPATAPAAMRPAPAADNFLTNTENLIAAPRANANPTPTVSRSDAALPNAFLFGLTGTPINRRDRNTFYAFGAEEDSSGYMSRYGLNDSIRDGATKELHFEPRLVDLHIDIVGLIDFVRNLMSFDSDLIVSPLDATTPKTDNRAFLGAKAYIHGHEVGGTNPSLVTAMGCGQLVLALAVPFNREVLDDIKAAVDRIEDQGVDVALARVVAHRAFCIHMCAVQSGMAWLEARG